MSRIINKRSAKSAIAIIADGEDEQWYLAQAKEHYPNETLKHTKLKPEMSQSKKSQDLFMAAKEMIDMGYTHVVLIVDLDTVRKDPKDLNSFKELYKRYKNAKEGRVKKNDKWMNRLIVLVNNPCLEFWYLLHYKQTTKFYQDYDCLKRDLRKIPSLSQYEKSESYYYSNPDIFMRLGGNEGLTIARRNSSLHDFSIDECSNHGISEMRLLFDFIDTM